VGEKSNWLSGIASAAGTSSPSSRVHSRSSSCATVVAGGFAGGFSGADSARPHRNVIATKHAAAIGLCIVSLARF